MITETYAVLRAAGISEETAADAASAELRRNRILAVVVALAEQVARLQIAVNGARRDQAAGESMAEEILSDVDYRAKVRAKLIEALDRALDDLKGDRNRGK